ncbi:CDP-alcohol phosphatidyltransferase-domain-containing protein [Scenedesmus sp. NREL 46B-D3]|nr:CDP-alcohol phosphatidyltransferase-domain-containing protein [Scenedesmus sp. NREL 46B-D3]
MAAVILLSSAAWTSHPHDVLLAGSNQYLGTSSNVKTAGNTEQQQRQHQQQQQRGFQGLPDWQQQLRRSNVVWNNHHHHQQQQLHYSAPNICTTHVSHWRERQQQQQCVLLTLVQGLRHSHQQHRCYHQDKQQQQQQQQQRWETQHAIPSKSPLTAAEAAKAAEGFQQQQQQQVPGSSWTSLPNLLSLSRVMSGPWAAYLVATQQWPLAFALTAAAAATDWADGYLARRLGHTSKLGSYLDPLGDKVLVASVVGTMGWNGMLPAWLAVLVVGRDTAQVCGMFVYRLKMFRGRWPVRRHSLTLMLLCLSSSSSSGSRTMFM